MARRSLHARRIVQGRLMRRLRLNVNCPYQIIMVFHAVVPGAAEAAGSNPKESGETDRRAGRFPVPSVRNADTEEKAGKQMKIGVKHRTGRDPGSAVRTDDGAGGSSHNPLERPRLGRELSRLTAHPSWQSPLQFAMTRMAERIVPSHCAIDGHYPDGCPVNGLSLGHHVRAVLGMPHEACQIDPALAPYLDELGKNASMFWAQPVTFSAFSLLCLLYSADQAPGTCEYGRLERGFFMGWLNRQLEPDTVRGDLIPGSYFERVQVRTPAGVFLPRHCTVECDNGGAIEVPAMGPPDLQSCDLSGRDLRGTDLRGANLRGVNLNGVNLQGANLQGANLRGADLQDADLQDADLQGADLRGANLRGANLKYADLRDISLQDADLQNANLQGANLNGVNLEGAT
ncbi:pentapeptide repeat-containing protein [Paraburkholderia sediminicola]|uniref:pentapeptide repeat-containing protein n=1 Tax=Paraburkholderia sediminicola TaxID=458836 RepID=UPI0038B94431